MLITRTSPLSGITRTLDIDITDQQIDYIEHKQGQIQHLVPHLSASEREFILTGITGQEWDKMFGGEEEYDEKEELPF